MSMTILIVSIIFTIIVLVLSLITISKGYAYKHTVDPLDHDGEIANKVNKE